MKSPTVFLSSTKRDLMEYRNVVFNVCRVLHLDTNAMEDFTARGIDGIRYSLTEVDKCDVYVGLFAHRYGYVPPGLHLSVTEAEYDQARKRGLECLCFFVADDVEWPDDKIEPGVQQQLDAFKQRIISQCVVRFFRNPDELRYEVHRALSSWLERHNSRSRLSDVVGVEDRSLLAPIDSTAKRSPEYTREQKRPNLLMILGFMVAICLLLLGVVRIPAILRGDPKPQKETTENKTTERETTRKEDTAKDHSIIPDPRLGVPEQTQLDVDLDIKVWKSGRENEEGKNLWSMGVRPLVPDDSVRIEVTANRGCFFYLVWVESTGKAVPLYPWLDKSWDKRLEDEQPLLNLGVPGAAGQGGKLTDGPAGVETLVLIAVEQAISDDKYLAESFAGLSDQKNRLPDPHLAAWLIDGEPDKGSRDRAPFSNIVDVYDPVGEIRELMRNKLRSLGGVCRSVSFGFQHRPGK